MALRGKAVVYGAGVAAVGAVAIALLFGLSGNDSAPDNIATGGCAGDSGLPAGWGKEPYAGMLRLSGGEFEPGNEHGYPEERPNGRVNLQPFWIDRTEVTNAQFADFVKATGYVTEAEREGAGVVFRVPEGPVQSGSWWHFVQGANWRHPDGPDSDIQGRDNHPVVQVTYADAQAYAEWLGRELPTEAQWEYAARAGGDGEKLEREPRTADGEPAANFWQGAFPYMNTADDGHTLRAPVGCFPANGYGLHDMIGNVWEWTRDQYAMQPQPEGTADWPLRKTAQGVPSMVIKGGSFLCADNYCKRYRSTSRHPQEMDLPITHLGFRTIRPAE